MNARDRIGKIRIGHLFSGLAVIGAGLLSFLFFFERARAAVEIVYFTAVTESDKIRLEWKTATELDNAGFYVLRNETGGGNPADYDQITVIDAVTGDPYDFIPARGEDLIGAVYPFYDEDVVIGTRYWYLLQDVDSSSSSSYEGPVDAVVGQTPTPTTIPVTPSSTSAAPSPTPSRTPTRTPTRTNTPLPGFIPSATPAPSLTPTVTLPPTATSTFTQSPIPPVDLTLTGIAVALTGMPTGTTTATSSPGPASPTPTRTARPSPTLSLAADAGDGPPVGRILLVVLIFLGSGGLLTAGVLFIARGSAGQGADEVERSDPPIDPQNA